MRLYLDDIHTQEFLKGYLVTSDQITNVNYAIIVILSIVIEENVLGVVVRLIDQQKLRCFGFATIIVPKFVIILYCHS
jgi:hypothetical protein